MRVLASSALRSRTCVSCAGPSRRLDRVRACAYLFFALHMPMAAKATPHRAVHRGRVVCYPGSPLPARSRVHFRPVGSPFRDPGGGRLQLTLPSRDVISLVIFFEARGPYGSREDRAPRGTGPGPYDRVGLLSQPGITRQGSLRRDEHPDRGSRTHRRRRRWLIPTRNAAQYFIFTAEREN